MECNAALAFFRPNYMARGHDLIGLKDYVLAYSG